MIYLLFMAIMAKDYSLQNRDSICFYKAVGTENINR